MTLSTENKHVCILVFRLMKIVRAFISDGRQAIASLKETFACYLILLPVFEVQNYLIWYTESRVTAAAVNVTLRENLVILIT